MPAQDHIDDDGYVWIVLSPDDRHAQVDVWWNRSKHVWDGRAPAEHLVLRQQNIKDGEADVVILTLGMVYDLIDALNKAVMEP